MTNRHTRTPGIENDIQTGGQADTQHTKNDRTTARRTCLINIWTGNHTKNDKRIDGQIHTECYTTDGQAYIHSGRKIKGQIDTQSKHAHTHRKVDRQERQANRQRMIYR